MKASKLILGTVQFGCQYGINSAGRPSEAAVADILSAAAASGITTLDTSSAYGNAEEVLGSCEAAGRFSIVSKYPQGSGPVKEAFCQSLERLGATSMHGYMLHHFSVYRSDTSVWEEFRALRDAGLTERIGFSLYSPDELEMLLENGVDFDLLQIPRNIFDRRFDPWLPELKARGVEVHVRSTFLQGLFFKDRDCLPEKLLPLRRYLVQLDRYSSESGLSVAQLALNFNLQNPDIAGVLIGVDNVSQLLANVEAVCDQIIDIDINVAEQELLSPVNWN